MKKVIADISTAEFEVLDALWQSYPATANQLISRLNSKKVWHEKTVKTLLSRLVKKQAISYEKQQRHYLYTPLLERDAYTQAQSQTFIKRLFSGRISPLVAAFAKSQHLDARDIDELKAIVADWEANNGDTTDSEQDHD